MKTAIIKGLFGSYDFWADPRIVEPSADYHVFTDQKIKSKVYEVHQLAHKPKLERRVKILPWEYLPGYDRYIWVDANIHPKQPMKQLPDADIICLEHPDRNCVYDEYKACLRLNKDNPHVMAEQINKYREQGFPENAGMVQTGLLVRKPNDVTVEHAELWYKEVETHSRRDQLSFHYAFWQQQVKPTVYAIGWQDFLTTFKLTAHKR